MANVSSLLAFSLCFLVFLHACFAQIEQVTSRQHPWRQLGGQHRLQYRRECTYRRLNTLEPTHRVKSEGGVTEFWDQSEEQIECAGVSVLRHTIQRRGLLLPHYTNTPKLVYVVQGRGTHGAVIPGCPETFQSPQSESRRETERGERGERGERSQRFRDEHQKIRRVHEGDVFALPAGITEWIYNNGDSPLVLFSVHYTSHEANQLDQNLRSFFLAGNPQQEYQIGGQRERRSHRGQEERGEHGRGQEERGEHGRGQEERGQHKRGQEERGRRHEERGRHERGREERGRQEGCGNNILSGFDLEILAEAFRIPSELARKLQGERCPSGVIIQVEGELEFLRPERQEEERQEPEPEERHREGGCGRANGLEETFCTLRLKHSLGDPSQADIYNPRAGRITTANSLNLPILKHVQLSAERGILHQNAIMTPHWNVNGHSIMYVTEGEGRVQIVSHNGDTVFDGRVSEGQLLVIPQNYPVIKRAGRQGLKWVAIKTTDHAMINQLAGKLSALRAIPAEVLVNAFGISREQVSELKFNREEVTVFPPGARSQRRE